MLPFILLAVCAAVAQGKLEITSDTKLAITSDTEGSRYYKVGARIHLSCISDEDATLQWTKIDAQKNETDYKTSLASEVLIQSAQLTDIGQYVCHDKKRGLKDSWTVEVIPDRPNDAFVKPEGGLVTVAGTPKEVVLRCEQKFIRKLPLVWYGTMPNGSITQLSNDSSKNITLGSENNGYALTIKNKEGDRFAWTPLYGRYYCQFNAMDIIKVSPTKENLGNSGMELKYQATPDVSFEGTAKTKSATKDEAFAMTCVTQGAGKTQPIVWKVKKEATGTDWVHVATEVLYEYDPNADAPIPDAPPNCSREIDESVVPNKLKKLVCRIDDKLTIARDMQKDYKDNATCQEPDNRSCKRTSTLQFSVVVDEDRGDYACFASNDAGENNATIPVKVKDKLAALWPFLGIVAEVVILCAIIFIYERRRSKSIEEEDEAEPMKSVDTRDTNDTVRNRKT